MLHPEKRITCHISPLPHHNGHLFTTLTFLCSIHVGLRCGEFDCIKKNSEIETTYLLTTGKVNDALLSAKNRGKQTRNASILHNFLGACPRTPERNRPLGAIFVTGRPLAEPCLRTWFAVKRKKDKQNWFCSKHQIKKQCNPILGKAFECVWYLLCLPWSIILTVKKNDCAKDKKLKYFFEACSSHSDCGKCRD